MGAPGTNTGICQGARWPEYDKWFQRMHNAVFNPGTAKPLAVSLWFLPDITSGSQALFTKSGEYWLLLEGGKLVFRIASNTGGGSWDKEVKVPLGSSTGWRQAIFWIVPGVEIGLCLDGGTPDTETLAPGQAARVVNGYVLVGSPSAPSSSSYVHTSGPPSSWWPPSSSYPWSSWALAAEALAAATSYEGRVDEIAVFDEILDSPFRAMLWNSGVGSFWRGYALGWGPCLYWSSSRSSAGPWSSSWHHASSHSSHSSWHWSSSMHWSSYSYPGSWAMRGGGEEAASRTGRPVTAGLLASASSDPPELVLCQYVWGTRHRDELILRDRDPDSGGGPLDERLYCAMDYFDPIAIVDVEGEVVERYGFTAFGRREVMAPDWSPRNESLFDWSFGFHGQFLDSETGYYNYGYRYYVPWLGRWPNRDPIEEMGGLNAYGFVGNGPIDRIDHMGLVTVADVIHAAALFGMTFCNMCFEDVPACEACCFGLSMVAMGAGIAGLARTAAVGVVAGAEPTPIGEGALLVLIAYHTIMAAATAAAIVSCLNGCGGDYEL